MLSKAGCETPLPMRTQAWKGVTKQGPKIYEEDNTPGKG